MSVSKKIKKMLLDNNISQEYLAVNIGMTKNGLNNNLSSDDFKLSTLQKIADFFKVPISYFFEGEVGPGANQFRECGKMVVNGQNNGNMILNEREEEFRVQIEHLEALLKAKEETIRAKDALIDVYQRQLKEN